MRRQFVKFETEAPRMQVIVELDISRQLTERDKRFLRLFYMMLKTSCRLLMEFAASRFRGPVGGEGWKSQCSFVRNELLSSSTLFWLTVELDATVNSFDELVGRPDETYASREPRACFMWLQEVRSFFRRASLLCSICVHWFAVPDRLAGLRAETVLVTEELLVHGCLYDDFVNSYFRGVVCYRVLGQLPAVFRNAL